VQGGNFVQVNGIDDKGDVVGRYNDTSGAIHGFAIENGQLFEEGVRGAAISIPMALNNSDQVAGYFTDTSGKTHGFYEVRHGWQTVDVPGAVTTDVWGSMTRRR
jgi:hypothetical protein